MNKSFKYSATGRSAIRLALLALAALSVVLLVWSATASAKTNATKPKSSANPVTYGKSVQITGEFKGKPSASIPIALQSSPFPYAVYTTIGTTTTSATGAYAFGVQPLINTRFRVATTAAVPQVVSGELAQVVNQRVSFSVGDKTPRKGVKVRFYGTVTPADDGTYVSLEKLSSTGVFNKIAKIKLVDSGTSRSSYSRRIRVSKNATYRVTKPATTSLGAGISATRTLQVH